MKTIKVSEATKLQLNWLVARIEGDELPKSGGQGLDYSSDWAVGGPIIEQDEITLHRMTNDWVAVHNPSGGGQPGPTPLIAAMRCFVTSRLGEEVEVPGELA